MTATEEMTIDQGRAIHRNLRDEGRGDRQEANGGREGRSEIRSGYRKGRVVRGADDVSITRSIERERGRGRLRRGGRSLEKCGEEDTQARAELRDEGVGVDLAGRDLDRRREERMNKRKIGGGGLTDDPDVARGVDCRGGDAGLAGAERGGWQRCGLISRGVGDDKRRAAVSQGGAVGYRHHRQAWLDELKGGRGGHGENRQHEKQQGVFHRFVAMHVSGPAKFMKNLAGLGELVS